MSAWWVLRATMPVTPELWAADLAWRLVWLERATNAGGPDER